jgi:hypothetical protein
MDIRNSLWIFNLTMAYFYGCQRDDSRRFLLGKINMQFDVGLIRETFLF